MEESSSGGRCGEIASDMSIILVTAAQLIFFTFFHKYISWPITGPDGSVTRLSMLTDDYFTWLPLVIVASILVIVANIVMIIYDRYWLRQTAWIIFCLIGIVMTGSLVSIFPFDFSVIPNATAAAAVPKWVTGFLIFMAVFYAIAALAQFVKARRHTVKNENR